MDPVTIAMIVSAVAPLVANGINDAINAGDMATAQNLANKAAQEYQSIMPPELREQIAQQQGGTELAGAAAGLDPRARSAQMKALDLLGESATSGGMTAQDVQGFRRARENAGQLQAGFQGAAAQNAAARGLQTGGQSEYVAALLGGQQSANLGAQMSGDAAAEASARRMRAIEGLGDLGSRVRGQDWGIASGVGGAQDSINRFNTGLSSDADLRNLGLDQQRFENDTRARDMRAKGYGIQSGALLDKIGRGDKNAAAWGAAASEAAKGVGGALEYDKKKKGA